jgi:hypothetical protein
MTMERLQRMLDEERGLRMWAEAALETAIDKRVNMQVGYEVQAVSQKELVETKEIALVEGAKIIDMQKANVELLNRTVSLLEEHDAGMQTLLEAEKAAHEKTTAQLAAVRTELQRMKKCWIPLVEKAARLDAAHAEIQTLKKRKRDEDAAAAPAPAGAAPTP